MKKIITLLLCFLTFDLYSQMWGNDTYSVEKDYENTFVLDHVVGTYFQSPLLGLAYQTEIFDDQYNFSIQGKFGYYKTLDRDLSKNNYVLIQLAPIFKISNKVSVGSYLINFQGDHPHPKVTNNQPTTGDPYYLGYSSPLSLFARIDVNSIIKTGFFSNSQIYYEVNHYQYLKITSFKIIYTQKIFKTHKRN